MITALYCLGAILAGLIFYGIVAVLTVMDLENKNE